MESSIQCGQPPAFSGLFQYMPKQYLIWWDKFMMGQALTIYNNVTITILSSGYVGIKYSYVARFNMGTSFNCLRRPFTRFVYHIITE